MAKTSPQNSALLNWCHRQRRLRRLGELRADRERRLAELGFDWDVEAARWEQRFSQLQEYRSQFGTCEVPHLWPTNTQLGAWVSIQRRRHHQGRLRADRFQRLDALGFVWSPEMKVWETRLGELKQFKSIHGHCDVPQKLKSNRALGVWVNTLRGLWKSGGLSAEKFNQLQELGFQWAPRSKQWEESFRALVAYKEKHGDCLVPDGAEGNLGAWVQSLRRSYAASRLSPEHVRRLEELGFCWDTRAAAWEACYEMLQRHLETQTPGSVSALPKGKLLAWILQQRYLRTLGKLSAERIRRLDQIGFEWSPHDANWERSFEQVRDLLARGTHRSQIPRRLKTWLRHQQEALRNGSMPASRVEKIESMLGSLRLRCRKRRPHPESATA